MSLEKRLLIAETVANILDKKIDIIIDNIEMNANQKAQLKLLDDMRNKIKTYEKPP